jgi:phosphoribosylformylglycinamidine synthase
MGQFVGCIEGMAEACRALDFPIVSGNVSLYNETKNDDGSGSAILPTPAIGGVGLLGDWRKSATIAFKAEGEVIWIIGGGWGTHLGQSLWLREIAGREEGPPPPVDLEAERRAGELVRAAIADGLVSAVHDCADGGALVAIAEMALAGDVGALLSIEAGFGPLAARLFGEDQGRYVVTVPASDERAIERARQAGLEVVRLGVTGGNRIASEGDGFSVALAELRRAHEGFFPTLMGPDAALA